MAHRPSRQRRRPERYRDSDESDVSLPSGSDVSDVETAEEGDELSQDSSPAENSSSSDSGSDSTPVLNIGGGRDRGRGRNRGRGRGQGRAPTQVQGNILPQVNWKNLDHQVPFQPIKNFTPPYPPGPKCNLLPNAEVSDVLDVFFTEPLLKHIVQETNRYAEQNGKLIANDNVYGPMSLEELKALIGMIVGISIKKIAQLQDIWSTDWVLNCPNYARIMTKNRFFFLMRHLHFVNNANIVGPEDPNFDKLFKVRHLIEHFQSVFQASYQLGKNISVDETMVKFKGRHRAKQYDPSKPIKRGFKLWTLADSSTGYVHTFQVYSGKSNDVEEESLPCRAVKSVITPDVHNVGHNLYMDRYFVYYELFADLKALGIYSTGTVKANRRLVPTKALKDACCNDRGKLITKQGDSHFMSTDDGYTATVWHDRKPILFLSNTFPAVEDGCSVPRRDRQGTRNIIQCPPCVKAYNMCMGGVDQADQMKGTYGVDRKSRRWYMRLVWHMFDWALNNAFIIYRANFQLTNPDQNCTLKNFRALAVASFVGDFSSRLRVGRPGHLPVLQGVRHPHVDLVQLGYLRAKRRCRICLQRGVRHGTNYGCHVCGDIPLCRVPMPCFEEYHANPGNCRV